MSLLGKLALYFFPILLEVAKNSRHIFHKWKKKKKKNQTLKYQRLGSDKILWFLFLSHGKEVGGLDNDSWRIDIYYSERSRPPIPGSIARKPFSSTGQALPSQQETATCCLLNLMIQCVSKIVSLRSDKISNRKGKYLSFEFYHLYFLMYI
jgi:hypothetical protein